MSFSSLLAVPQLFSSSDFAVAAQLITRQHRRSSSYQRTSLLGSRFGLIGPYQQQQQQQRQYQKQQQNLQPFDILSTRNIRRGASVRTAATTTDENQDPLFQTDRSSTNKQKQQLQITADRTQQEQQFVLHSAFLFSRFSEGLKVNRNAHRLLRRSLLQSMLSQEQFNQETAVKQSVLYSPCAGPNLDAVDRLNRIDQALERLSQSQQQQSSEQQDDDDDDTTVADLLDVCLSPLKQTQPQTTVPSLRVLYIPTALYAIRSDSTNTPGKQRQRARYDAKQRRDALVAFLRQLFADPSQQQAHMSISIVTMDLDDGSVKQPQSVPCTNTTNNDDEQNLINNNNNTAVFPSSGREALTTWAPHLVYVQGGNTFWLHHCLEKGNWTQDLINLIAVPTAAQPNTDKQQSATPKAVYCAASAGAIVTGATVQTATWKQWDDPTVVSNRPTYQDWQNVPAMNLIPDQVSFFPHMTPQWKALFQEKTKNMEQQQQKENKHNNTDGCLDDTEDKTVKKVVALNEDDVYYVNGIQQQGKLL